LIQAVKPLYRRKAGALRWPAVDPIGFANDREIRRA
jgi:hypothetical protein